MSSSDEEQNLQQPKLAPVEFNKDIQFKFYNSQEHIMRFNANQTTSNKMQINKNHRSYWMANDLSKLITGHLNVSDREDYVLMEEFQHIMIKNPIISEDIDFDLTALI